MKKLKKNLILLCFGLLAVGIYQPSLNPIKEISPLLEQLNQLIFQEAPKINPPKISSAWVKQTKDKVLGLTHSITVPKNISGLPEDVVVDDAIDMVTNELKKLPQKQIEKIKVNICEQILTNASASAE